MGPTLTLPGNILRGSIVYIHRMDSEIVYVGMSRFGIARPIQHLRLTINSTLEIIQCDSIREAQQLEAKLIREHNPRDNNCRIVKLIRPKPNRLRAHYAAVKLVRKFSK